MIMAARVLSIRACNAVHSRSMKGVPPRLVTMVAGEGIGPEVSNAVIKVFEAAKVPIDWEPVDVTPVRQSDGSMIIPQRCIDSMRKNKIGLKGPLNTTLGKGPTLLTLALRKEFGLYVNIRPCKSMPGNKIPYDNADLVTIRENTEGEFAGTECESVPNGVQTTRLITEQASRRCARFAFDFAKAQGRKSVTAVHKKMMMHKADELFIRVCREESAAHPEIQFADAFLDTVCLNIVRKPSVYDVLVVPNLYGDIVSDLASALIGGIGVTISANIGHNLSVFEAMHGTAADIAGRDMANPTAQLLAGVLMLQCMHLHEHADRIQKAIMAALADGTFKTGDMGGTGKCSQFTQDICERVRY